MQQPPACCAAAVRKRRNDSRRITSVWTSTRRDTSSGCGTDSQLKRYYYPQKARFANGKYRLEYANGSIATVRLEEKDKYFKLTLEALDNREGISGIQWGNYYTNINNLLGDIIGVARDTTMAVNYAIGVLALDDNTLGGESRFTSETGFGGYIAHSPDPVNHPLPITLHEGQQFTMGGDGISDVAFYNRREPYYRMLYGGAATVDENGRIYIHYLHPLSLARPPEG